ncbi:MAG: protein-glutamate O-methyltransferase CheR [Dehalococcoidia bacterium]
MDDATFTQLKRSLAKLLDLDLDGYKQPQMRRRIETFVTKHGNDPVAFIDRLPKDPELLQATRDMLTINVTEFFRDRAQWDRLEGTVLPSLVKQRNALKIWSAGCSHGQEPISLAILLDEAGALRRSSILATDFDHAALARAKAGGPYTQDEVRGISPKHLSTYFTAKDGKYVADPKLLKQSTYRELNLLKDRFANDFDLIVCRNVMIYFEADVKAALIRRFREALRPGGVLFIGATEALLGADAEGLTRLGGNFYARAEEAKTGRLVA